MKGIIYPVGYFNRRLSYGVYIVVLALGLGVAHGQKLNDSLLATFYNQTLTYYYSDTIIHEDQTKFGCIIYETDFDSSKLIKNVGINKFKFINSKTDEHSILVKPYKKNIDRSIYWISYKQISQDTIDINIGKWTIGYCDKKTLSLAISCGGTMGYVPNTKFIYNKATNTWSFTAPLYEIITQLQKGKKKN